MSTIEKLTRALKRAEEARNAEVIALRDQLHELYAKQFDLDKKIQSDLRSLEASREYGEDDCGIYRWVRIAFEAPKDPEEKSALEAYLSDRGAHAVWKDQAIVEYLGECLVIDEGGEGDVHLYHGYGSSKIVVSLDQYMDDERGPNITKRNELIREWMEANGHFPEVFEQNGYGNLKSISVVPGAEFFGGKDPYPNKKGKGK